jgi:hypothetical protein
MKIKNLLAFCIVLSFFAALFSVASDAEEHKYKACPDGPGVMVKFKDSMRVNGTVTVMNYKTGYKATRQLPIQSKPDECANEVVKAAFEVNLDAEWGGPGSGTVRVCGKRNTVSVFGASIDSRSF